MASDKKCCVPGCFEDSSPRHSLHLFPNPLKDLQRFNTWVSSIGGPCLLGLTNEHIRKYRRVCNAHFEEKFWCRNNRLSNVAVPTQNLAGVHRFPNPEKFPDQFKAWVRTMGQKLESPDDYGQYRHKRVCALHFTEKDWNRNNRLNALAVPTKHLPANVVRSLTATKRITQIRKPETSFPSKIPGVPQDAPASTSATIDDDLQEDDRVEDELYEDNQVADYQVNTEPEPVPDPPAPVPPKFSWLETSTITLDDETPTVSKTADVAEDQSEAIGDKSDTAVAEDDVRSDVRNLATNHCCDGCRQYITGYTCVQCDDYDLCAACEARLIHPQHYMLRVPGPRPQREVKLVIDAIRKKLELLESELNNDGIARVDWDVEIKKEEDPFEETIADTTQLPMGDTKCIDASNNNNTNRSDILEQDNSENFDSEVVPNDKRKANEQDDWLDDPLLEVDNVDSCDGNKRNAVNNLASKEPNKNIIPQPLIKRTYGSVTKRTNALQFKEFKLPPELNILNSKNSDSTFKAPNIHKSRTILLSGVNISKNNDRLYVSNKDISIHETKRPVNLSPELNILDPKKSDSTSKAPNIPKSRTILLSGVNIDKNIDRLSVSNKDISIHETKRQLNLLDDNIDDGERKVPELSKIIAVSKTIGETTNITSNSATCKRATSSNTEQVKECTIVVGSNHHRAILKADGSSRKRLLVPVEDISKLITQHKVKR